MMAKSFFQLREWCSRQCNTCTYIQQSAHRCVVAVFEGPVQVCITHPLPPIRSCLSLSLSVQYRSDAHISSKHLYIRCVIPAKHLPPSTSLLSGLPSPSPLSPVTKTHWQSFWPFFCIHDLKKDPLYPQLRENAFDQFVTSPCALSSVVFHLIGFHLAFKQSIKKSE
jgi:hypothetical protein